MINIRSIRKLKDNDGLTLKNGKVITYKSGWQVTTEGIETISAKVAIQVVKAYGGNCGIWFSNGIYYIDKSHRVNTKREAMEVGRAHNQISVLNWRTMGGWLTADPHFIWPARRRPRRADFQYLYSFQHFYTKKFSQKIKNIFPKTLDKPGGLCYTNTIKRAKET